MRSRMIHQADGQRSFVVVLSTGDEVMAELAAFIAHHDVQAASFSAIGAFSEAELGYFDWGRKDYVAIPVPEQVEVASLTGDVAIGPDGKPALHIHTVLGRRDGSAIAGHLKRALVRPTLEIVLEELPARLRKRYDPESGLALIQPEADPMPDREHPAVTGMRHAPAPKLPKHGGDAQDPNGVAPADKAAQDEPKALPNSDRHRMETAIARQGPRRQH